MQWCRRLVPTLLFVGVSVGRAFAAPGDVDGNGGVELRDLAVLIHRLFDVTIQPAPGADANGDGFVGAADLVFVVYAVTGDLPVATPPTGTATRTFSSTPSPTPTPTSIACVSAAITPGTITGQLDLSDCKPTGGSRPTDVYDVAAIPGQAMKVSIAASGFAPSVIIQDAGVYFGQAKAPTEFLTTTARPYRIFVSSAESGGMTGAYSLSVSVRDCPTAPIAVTPTTQGTSVSGTLRNDGVRDCPDPAQPDLPAHRYTFTAHAGTPVRIDMATNPNSTAVPDPFLSLYGPAPTDAFTGYVLASDDRTGGVVANGTTSASLFFYPLENGTYTIVASGAGKDGPYTIDFSLPACAATPVTVSSVPMVLNGTLRVTSCPAPPALPTGGASAVNTRADLWTVDLSAGDVIGVKMTSADPFDAQLYLLAPEHTLLAADNDDSEDGGTDAQLAFTVPRAGTYTVVAASNDATVTQDGGTARYQLEIQRCPARTLTVDVATDTAFTVSDCRGDNGVHVNSYRLEGAAAGEFATITMAAAKSDLDAVLSVVGSNGIRSDNDDDPFANTTDARVSQILAPDATLFVSASSFPANGTVEGDFVLWAKRCRTIAIAGPTANGEFRSDDCTIAGRAGASAARLNVFTIDAGGAHMLSTVAPGVGCAWAVANDGTQGPGTACSTNYLALAAATAGPMVLIVAANDQTTSGSYSFPVSLCPTRLLTYESGDQTGAISSASCLDAAGVPGDAFIFRAPEGLTTFNAGWSGQLVGDSFSNESRAIDRSGITNLSDSFSVDADNMWRIGSDLMSALVVRPSDSRGSETYRISVTPAFFH
ncbi:MAG TPA: pre-peptidase C-terminal domain-containing protein [Candidatus Binatia bacterium]|nr:pre-peptidase C-terminal domain-containing protein [Candidatus Binatia bacterium]